MPVKRIDSATLVEFVVESNRIEGILRDPRLEEVDAHARFLAIDTLAWTDVEALVGVLQPGAALRNRKGMNVRVGPHIAPPGGPNIAGALTDILADVNHCVRDHVSDEMTCYAHHLQYETLHPFMDGNGRSGRALWLWEMARLGYDGSLLFLHRFYYQALQATRP